MLIFQTLSEMLHTQSPQNLTSLMPIDKNIKKNKNFAKKVFQGVTC